MAMQGIERLHYYQRQYLGAEDFKAQQEYHRDMRRRHNLGHHTWGIVVGLELIERPSEGASGVDIFVQPGLAIDGYGREIIISEPTKLDASLFDAFANLLHREVWIAYEEERSKRPQPGFELCDTENQFGRVQETFRIVVEPGQKTRDDIVVAGKKAIPPPPVNPGDLTIPTDESVPYQELPEEEVGPRWLVRLGSANWDGVNHKFVAAAAGRLLEGRRYVGLVAESILAPVENLRLRPRAAFADPDATDFANVEGRLRVDGRVVAKKDVLMHGGKLSFQDAGGTDANTPLWITRREGPGSTGYDLRIHIGDDASEKTRLTVGPADGANEKVVLAVKGDDTVDIPTGTLSFGNTYRQMINLGMTSGGDLEYGIGVREGATYFRSHKEFCWFKGGVHSDDPNNPSGGSLQLRLDWNARLHFGADARQMLNLWKEEYGIGIQTGTLYSRTASEFCWFRKGSHSNAKSDPGSGGTLAMRLDSQSNLSVGGNLTTQGSITVSPGDNKFLKARHIVGKNAANEGLDELYLNYNTGKDVVIGGGGAASSLLVHGGAWVNGDMFVEGLSNLIHVEMFPVALKNKGVEQFATMKITYDDFAKVYAVFAVLQGFSIFDNGGKPLFDYFDHFADVGGIPQHVFVRVSSWNDNEAEIVAYCSQSEPAEETNNTVLANVIVIGKLAAQQ